jgi:hypothetical protein
MKPTPSIAISIPDRAASFPVASRPVYLTPQVVDAMPETIDIVTSPDLFPTRTFPPGFAETVGASLPNVLEFISLDVGAVTEFAGLSVVASGRELRAVSGNISVEIYLPNQFPLKAPIVAVRHGGALHILATFWKPRSAMSVEHRIGFLFKRAFICAQEL